MIYLLIKESILNLAFYAYVNFPCEFLNKMD